MKIILLSTVLITLLSASTLQATELSFTGSLDCSFLKNKTEKTALIVTKGEDYEEESTELYYGNVGDVQADVLYLPYQYGIILSLKYNDIQKEAEGESKASLTLEANGNTYTLSCKK
jgi:hypothetical protein